VTGSVFALRPAIALVALAATAALAHAADAVPLAIAIKDGTVPREQRMPTFKAFASGRFSVHAHEGQARGGSSTHAHGRSVLLRLEVHPQ